MKKTQEPLTKQDSGWYTPIEQQGTINKKNNTISYVEKTGEMILFYNEIKRWVKEINDSTINKIFYAIKPPAMGMASNEWKVLKKIKNDVIIRMKQVNNFKASTIINDLYQKVEDSLKPKNNSLLAKEEILNASQEKWKIETHSYDNIEKKLTADETKYDYINKIEKINIYNKSVHKDTDILQSINESESMSYPDAGLRGDVIYNNDFYFKKYNKKCPEDISSIVRNSMGFLSPDCVHLSQNDFNAKYSDALTTKKNYMCNEENYDNEQINLDHKNIESRINNLIKNEDGVVIFDTYRGITVTRYLNELDYTYIFEKEDKKIPIDTIKTIGNNLGKQIPVDLLTLNFDRLMMLADKLGVIEVEANYNAGNLLLGKDNKTIVGIDNGPADFKGDQAIAMNEEGWADMMTKVHDHYLMKQTSGLVQRIKLTKSLGEIIINKDKMTHIFSGDVSENQSSWAQYINEGWQEGLEQIKGKKEECIKKLKNVVNSVYNSEAKQYCKYLINTLNTSYIYK